MPDTVDIPTPAQPGATPQGAKMEDSTKLMFEQAFAKSHELSLNEVDRENAGWGFIAEQGRLDFIASNNNSTLAQGVLGQRSAGGQPQSSAANAGVAAGK